MSKQRVNVALISPIELSIVEKMQRSVNFPPYSSHKRFIRVLGPLSEMCDGGRNLLAYCAHRYRRQWRPSPEETSWIQQWKSY